MNRRRLRAKRRRRRIRRASQSPRIRVALVLGAGASRGVSYANAGSIQSPLDSDFFDLLQRLRPRTKDKPAVDWALEQLRSLPHECWRSMERVFYTLHLQAFMDEILRGGENRPEAVVSKFARCVQALLRKAHGRLKCDYHQKLLDQLHDTDTVLSFNYDLVPERAVRPIAEGRGIAFGPWLYGLGSGSSKGDLPLLLKLHGSSNWRIGRPSKFEYSRRIGAIWIVPPAIWATWVQTGPSRSFSRSGTSASKRSLGYPYGSRRLKGSPKADALLVWGYSLPETDIKSQHLFKLAGTGRPMKLCIVDPSDTTRQRWRELLPEAEFWSYPCVAEFLKSPPPWWQAPV